MKTEQIEKASLEYATKTAEDYCECNSEFVQELMVAFECGARYALSHQWVSVDEALPEDEEYVLINGKRGIEPAVWNDHYKCWDDAEGDDYMYDKDAVTHWMSIPKLTVAEAESDTDKETSHGQPESENHPSDTSHGKGGGE